jgi:restriction endonuclease
MTRPAWQSYEEVAGYLLHQMAAAFGLERVEGKQGVLGLRSGTEYIIDAKGIALGTEKFVIIECRRYTTSRQKQENLAALAYRILDTGAVGGILVSPLGVQEGARKIAQAENVISVQLTPDSTTTEYVLKFLNQLYVGVADESQFSDKAVAIIRNEVTGEETRVENSD